MDPIPRGPLAQLDGAALNAVAKVSRVMTWPTWSILATFWTYVVTLVMAQVAMPFYTSRGMRELLLALPLLTLVLHVGAIFWVYRASDEYQRLRMLRSAAIAGVILAFSSLGYFCLEQFGYPHLPILIVSLYGWSIFLLVMLWARYRAR